MHEAHALISFDLSLIPKNADIVEASLVFTRIPYSSASFLYINDPATFDRDGSYTLSMLSTSWSADIEGNKAIESWSKFDSSSNSNSEVTLLVTPDLSISQFNVTNHISSMVSESKENYGFIVKTNYDGPVTNGWGGLWSSWHSSESSNQVARPKLSIQYLTNETVENANAKTVKMFSNIKLSANKDFFNLNIQQQLNIGIKIYTISGELICSFVKKKYNAGINLIQIPENISNGMYIVRLEKQKGVDGRLIKVSN